MCLLPSDKKQEASDESHSDDLSDDGKSQRTHNLEASKGFTAFIKISTMATEMSSKNANEKKIANIIKRKPVL